MDNRRYPHPHRYPPTCGIKRAYSDENSFSSNNKTTTLIGNDFAAAGSHRQDLSAQYGQQRRRTSQTVPIASPFDPFILPGEIYCLQGSLQPPVQGVPYSTTTRELTDNPVSSGLYRPPQGLILPFNNFNQAQSHSLQFQDPSSTFAHMRPDGQRGQRQTRFNVEESIESGSEDSRTLRSSQSLSRTASLGGPYNLPLSGPNDISHSSIPDSSCSVTMIGDLENDTREGLATLGTHDSRVPYSETWQNQDSPPWSTYGPSYPRRYFSNQRLSLEPIDEGLLYVDPYTASMDPSSVNPISFESINVSQPSHELPAAEYSSMLQGLESTPFVGMGYPFPGYQDEEDTGIGETMLDIYDRQSLYSGVPGPNSDTMRSFHLNAGDPITSNLYTPLARQVSVETSHTMNHGPLTIQSTTPEERNHQSFDQESVRLTAATERIWEHSVVRDGALRTLENHARLNDSTKKTKGSRYRPLSIEAREKAAIVRRIKSCLNCWIKHLPCDENEVCKNCRLPSPYNSRVCIKTSVHYHTDRLFPEFLVARHGKAAIADTIKDNVSSFTGNEIEIQISSAPHYPPMTLSVFEFSTRNDDFLVLYHSPPNPSSPSSILEKVYSPPVGLSGAKIRGRLRDECKKHVREMTKHERFPGDATNGDAAPVSRKILEAINCYKSSKPGSANLELIRKSTQLLATHFFMRKIIAFTPDSTQMVYNSLISPWKLPYHPRPSSKLLNSQVKREVHVMQRELTRDILQELEVDMRKKSAGLWVTCFSVLVILCICMEAVQLSIDGFIVQGLLTEDPGSHSEKRADGFHTGRLLEDHLFGDLLEIFTKIYQSGKFKKFHPIRDGANADNPKDLDQSSVQFINEVHEIVKNNRGHLEEKARNPSWGADENLLLDHYRYRRENSGRLVATFLLSFL